MKLNLTIIGTDVFKRLTRSHSFEISKERLEKEMIYLNNLREPENDIARSYCQYLCQMFYFNFVLRLMFNVLAGLFLIPTIIFFLIKNVGNKSIPCVQAVFLMSQKYNKLLPHSIIREFEEIVYDGYHVKMMLRIKDIRFVYEIIKCKPFSCFFIYKLLLRLALYRGIINRYHPVAIITASEYSFLSSMLTKYCEYNNVMHINIMHGERFLEIGSSFFRFTRCYVWDEYYVNIFNTLRAYKNQFIVEVPPALEIRIDENMSQMDNVDFKYYLTDHTDRDLKRIASNVDKLLVKGYKVKVRPHPIYCTGDIAKNYFSQDILEYIDSVSIEASLNSTKSVIGVDSTVLLQAYLCGKRVVFDDLVYAERLKTLVEYGYILLCRNVKRDYLSYYII
jgi:hypothetical protein